MEWIHYNSITFGALTGILLILTNLLHWILCRRFGIKVLEFGIFYSIGFSLFTKKINETQFTLGWFPSGSYVKPLGMTADSEEQALIPDAEKHQAYFTKPDAQKALIAFAPTFTYILFGVLLSFTLMKMQNSSLSVSELFLYLKEACISMFGDEAQRKSFGMLTVKFVAENNIVLFSFFLFSCAMLVWSIFDNVHSYLMYKSDSSRLLQKFWMVFYYGYSIILLWKIPSLLFDHYSFSEIMVYVINWLAGIFMTGSLLFFIFVFIARKLNDNNRIQNYPK